MGSHFRFSPPPLEVDDALLWMLRRAFAPLDASVPAVDGEAAWSQAGRHGLAARIGSRQSKGRLSAEIGEHAEAAAAASKTALVHALAYEALAGRVAEIVAGTGARIFVLKGVALHVAGHATPGSREVGDLDLLVAETDAAGILDLLLAAGFHPSADPRNEHHLPPLQAPTWGNVDLHDRLRGVCDGRGRWLGVDALGDSNTAGHRPSSSSETSLAVPDRDVLAAHALAHGIDQHSTAPHRFPLMRTFADLIDLLPSPEAWSAALDALRRLLRTTVSAEELEAAREACMRLVAGDLPAADSPGGRLLAHFIAHAADSEYRSGLKWLHRRRRVAQAWNQGNLFAFASRKWSDLLR